MLLVLLLLLVVVVVVVVVVCMAPAMHRCIGRECCPGRTPEARHQHACNKVKAAMTGLIFTSDKVKFEPTRLTKVFTPMGRWAPLSLAHNFGTAAWATGVSSDTEKGSTVGNGGTELHELGGWQGGRVQAHRWHQGVGCRQDVH